MATEQGVPLVHIDDNGTFKYIFIKVMKDGGSFLIVRGYGWAEYHDDIYQEVSARLEADGFETECIGGGRIEHRAADKKLKVYGYSQAFGRGNHAKAVEMLKTNYPDYEMSWSNEGY